MEQRGDAAPHLAQLPLPTVATLLKRYLEFVGPLDGIEDKEASMNFVRQVMHCLTEGNNDISPEWRGIPDYFRFLESVAGEYKRFCNTSLRTSHMAPLWNALYLGNRDPLPVGWNYTLSLDAPSLEKTSRHLNVSSQALRAAIIGAASFHVRALINGSNFFTPEGQNRMPKDFRVDLKLCHDQFARLFRVARIPHRGMDGLRWTFTNNVLILRKGHAFVLDWIHFEENDDDVGSLGSQWLKEIIANAQLIDTLIRETVNLPQNEQSPLVLSSGHRGTWADVFEKLWAEKTSRAALDDITSCSFAICLDDEVDFSLSFHGGKYPENRYPDINVMYIVNPAGGVSCNIEHSWGDGHTMLLVCSIIYHYTISFLKEDVTLDPTNVMKNASQGYEAHVKPVRFGPLEKDIIETIIECHQNHDRCVNETNLTVRNIRSFGTSEIKRYCRVSPDAFVHSAFHIAQRRLFGDQRSTYCALLMKIYSYGRTETLRTVTQSTQALADVVESVVNKNSFDSTVSKALQRASREHRSRIVVCRAGDGFHRGATLLRRLHDVAKERMLLLHAVPPCLTSYDINKVLKSVDALFFASPALQELSSDYLSTSNITGRGILSLSFAATLPDGMGIGYSLFPDRLTFSFSSFKSCARPLKGASCGKLKNENTERNICEEYADVLVKTIHDLYRLSATLPPSKL